jgi:type II secretory pathway component GspD/PulD (secretin)
LASAQSVGKRGLLTVRDAMASTKEGVGTAPVAADTIKRVAASPRGFIPAAAVPDAEQCRLVLQRGKSMIVCTPASATPMSVVPTASDLPPLTLPPTVAATTATPGNLTTPRTTEAPSNAAAPSAATELLQPSAAPVVAAAPRRTPVGMPDSSRVTANFFQTPLADVVSLFSRFSGRSILMSDETDVVAKRITADVRKQPWRDALDLLARAHSLRVVEDSATAVLTIQSEKKATETCGPRVIRLEYAYAEDVVPVLKQMLGVTQTTPGGASAGNGCDRIEVVKTSSDAAGGSTGKSSTIVVFTTGDRMPLLTGLIDQLDVRKARVLIQTRLVLVNRSMINKLGFQYTLQSAGVANPNQPAPISNVAVTPMANQNQGSGGGSNQPFRILQSLAVGGTTTLNTFVEALSSIGLAEVDVASSIVTTSEIGATISVGEFFLLPQSQPFFGGTVPGQPGQVGGGVSPNPNQGGVVTQPGGGQGQGGLNTSNQGLSNPAFGFAQFNTGTVLKVTPTVLKTGEIRLAIELSRDGGTLGSNGQTITGGRQQVVTNLIVRDGTDIPLGGMKVVQRSTTNGGVPVLSDFPLIGGIFKSKEEAELFQDLIIVVTPRLFEDPALP